jgi:hypothetical protein
MLTKTILDVSEALILTADMQRVAGNETDTDTYWRKHG